MKSTNYYIHRINRILKEKKNPIEYLLKPVVIKIKTRLGIPMRLRTPGRSLLEKVVLPYYASIARGCRVLFVGCDWYTQHYKKVFRDAEFWTIDPDPSKKRFGARNHIVGYLEELCDYFIPEYFDFIICNGVLGHGLDKLEQADLAFNSCFVCLRQGGKFMVGRDEYEGLVPFEIEEMTSLQRFVSCSFPPLKTWRYSLTPVYAYVFCFYEKPYGPKIQLDLSKT